LADIDPVRVRVTVGAESVESRRASARLVVADEQATEARVTRLTETATNNKTKWLRQVAEQMATALGSSERDGFAAWESAAIACGNEIIRRALESELQRLADAEGDEVHGNGSTYERHRPGSDRLSLARSLARSLACTLRVLRWTYRERGTDDGPTLVPLDQCAGIRERATHRATPWRGVRAVRRRGSSRPDSTRLRGVLHHGRRSSEWASRSAAVRQGDSHRKRTRCARASGSWTRASR